MGNASLVRLPCLIIFSSPKIAALYVHSNNMIHSFSLLVNQTFALVPRLAAPYVSARLAEVALRDEGGEVGLVVATGCGARAALADGVGVVVGHSLLLATSCNPGARRGSPPNS